LRRRSYLRVLDESAMLRATRTLNRRSPRMVKRRNSPYASHNRNLPIRVPIDCTPVTVGPMPRRRRERQRRTVDDFGWSSIVAQI
jgi:hypothetical protein